MFLLSSCGAPLAQRASYLALHSSLFRPVFVNRVKMYIFPMVHTLTIVKPIWPMLQTYQKLWVRWAADYANQHFLISLGEIAVFCLLIIRILNCVCCWGHFLSSAPYKDLNSHSSITPRWNCISCQCPLPHNVDLLEISLSSLQWYYKTCYTKCSSQSNVENFILIKEACCSWN